MQMKIELAMRIAFTVILITILLVAFYVVWHLWRITPGGWHYKLVVAGLFVIWMAIGISGFIVMERIPVKVAVWWYQIGNTWLIAILYLLLAFLMADIASLLHLLPKTFLRDSIAGLATVVGVVALVMALGGVHYHHKYREEMTLHTDKPLKRPLTIVLASDLHVGYHNRGEELRRWIDLFNAEHPDLVLIGGDIVDMSLRPVLEWNYADEFRRLQAPVFTVLGNHEYFGKTDKAVSFFRESGIHLLRDEVIDTLGIRIVGRDDRSNRRRKSLATLVGNSGLFTIVVDHQPYHLEEAEAAGVDFQFSGHTHRGQVWPISWITDAVYEKSWGHHQRGNTRFYISSGLGIWGPKIRVGTRSEYLVLKLSNL